MCDVWFVLLHRHIDTSYVYNIVYCYELYNLVTSQSPLAILSDRHFASWLLAGSLPFGCSCMLLSCMFSSDSPECIHWLVTVLLAKHCQNSSRSIYHSTYTVINTLVTRIYVRTIIVWFCTANLKYTVGYLDNVHEEWYRSSFVKCLWSSVSLLNTSLLLTRSKWSSSVGVGLQHTM